MIGVWVGDGDPVSSGKIEFREEIGGGSGVVGTWAIDEGGMGNVSSESGSFCTYGDVRYLEGKGVEGGEARS